MQGDDEQQILQRNYYSKTAHAYDAMHYDRFDEHEIALAWLKSIIELHEIRSILDIGSGTGRALISLQRSFPTLRIVGIEPSRELREIGYGKGLARDQLIDGDARNLSFADGSFDLVCEFATLHHIPRPHLAVREMVRVSSMGVFISDSNKYGQGSLLAKITKYLITRMGLWKAFDLLRTRGKGYFVSDGDGVFYSYSVFDDLALIKKSCSRVHIMNTTGGGAQARFDASHIALFGLKSGV